MVNVLHWNSIELMVNFVVEKKVSHYFLDWHAKVSITKKQKLEWLFFFDKIMITDDVGFVGRRRICRTMSYSSDDDVVFVGRRRICRRKRRICRTTSYLSADVVFINFFKEIFKQKAKWLFFWLNMGTLKNKLGAVHCPSSWGVPIYESWNLLLYFFDDSSKCIIIPIIMHWIAAYIWLLHTTYPS